MVHAKPAYASTHLVPGCNLSFLRLALCPLPLGSHYQQLLLVLCCRRHGALLRNIALNFLGAGLLLPRPLVALLHCCNG